MRPLKIGRNSFGPEMHDKFHMDFSGPANIGLEESKEYHHIIPIKCKYGDSPTNAQDSKEETMPGFDDSDLSHPPVLYIDEEYLENFNKK